MHTEHGRIILWLDGEPGAERYDFPKDPGEHINQASNPEFADLFGRMTSLLRTKRDSTNTKLEELRKGRLFKKPGNRE